jgi:hypothetical protein
MKQNSIIEMGSKVDVIISFRKQTTINGKDYAPFEPYLFLKDVKALLKYKELNKRGPTRENTLNVNFADIDTLILSDITFSKKIASLYVDYIGPILDQQQRKFVSLTCYDGDPNAAIYMNEDFDIAEGYYIYDSDFTKVEDAIYDGGSNSFSSPSFTASEEYLVSFSSGWSGEKYSLKQNMQPLLHIGIQGRGNIDKEGKKVLINIDKASLNSALSFNFIPGDKINSPLDFVVMKSDNNYIVFED